MALWDAVARLHGASLARLLGGIEKPVRAYGAVGYDGAVASARSAERWARRGFTGIKAKIGYPSVEEDLAVIRAMFARGRCDGSVAYAKSFVIPSFPAWWRNFANANRWRWAYSAASASVVY